MNRIIINKTCQNGIVCVVNLARRTMLNNNYQNISRMRLVIINRLNDMRSILLK